MKRVLVISYYWPPSGGSGVQRWVKFSKYLPSEGWQPVIYTPENPELTTTDYSLEEEIPQEAEIIKTHIFEPYGIYRTITGSKKKESQSEVNPINAQKKTLKQKISMLIRGNLFIPDPRCMWISPSVKFLKKYLKEHPADIIISTGPPHSMHLIAKGVAQATGIPWIADFRDPWTKMFYFKHLGLSSWAEKRHKALEKTVLDSADAIVAVSPLVQEEFQEMTSTPVHLITNGYDEEDFDQVVEQDGYFNITHTGLFASDGDPEALWAALAQKCREDKEFSEMLRIRLAGKNDKAIISSIINAGLAANLRDIGYVSHQDAVREQKNASVLILPLRKEPEYKATIPGKLFEYLASRKPVLGIGQKDGAMARILESSKAGVVSDWNEYADIYRYISNCWELFKADKLEAGTENIEKYTRKALTRDMAALMDSLIKTK